MVVLCRFRRDVLCSVPSAAQTSLMSLQRVFAFLSATQVITTTNGVFYSHSQVCSHSLTVVLSAILCFCQISLSFFVTNSQDLYSLVSGVTNRLTLFCAKWKK